MSRIALAVDLGGTKIEAALVDETGAVITASRHRVPTGRDITPERLGQSVSAVVAAALDHLPQGADFAGAGVGSAGPDDLPAGTIKPVNKPLVMGFESASSER
ncbi:MAG: ROK family protein, partial [Microbacterium gubbeenense]